MASSSLQLFGRSAIRRAAAAAAASTATAAAPKGGAVPDVLVSFGARAQKITFISHPGVMAVAKLLEMRHITRPRAVLTQQNVDAIREFDPELSRKAQVALDNGLAINFMELEHIDRPGYVERLRKEKDILDTAAEEVLKAPVGQYNTPQVLRNYERPEVPRSWRPELEITAEMMEAQPGLREDLELQELMKLHLNEGKTAAVTAGEKSKALPPSGGGKPIGTSTA